MFLKVISFCVYLIAVAASVRCASVKPPVEQPIQIVAQNSKKKSPVPITSAQLLERIKESGARAVVVNLWSTYCDPCVEEIPEFLAQMPKLETNGVLLWFASMDFDDHWDEAASLLYRLGYDGQPYVNGEDDAAFIEGLSPRWSGLLPTTLLFDGQGGLLDLREGKLSGEELNLFVRNSLSE